MSPANEGPIQRLCRLGLRVLAPLAFIAPLFTRVVLGVCFHVDGHGKLQHLDKVTGFFSDLGIPFPGANAAFISGLEFAAGLCLVIGFGTRISAFLLACTMFVALLTSDGSTLIQKFNADVSTITDVTSFTYLMLLLWLVMYGPGPISLDWLISKRLGLDGKPREAS